ncbi:MAG: aromatase/cyclase [Acidobacteriota bacterium]|nr:aromatase/cyclase [Acidobacteriota bacterium]
MRHLEVTMRVPDRSPAEIYETLCDFEQYPQHSKEVRRVGIDSHDDGQMLSTWETNFRGGILRWVEKDYFNPAARTIDFEQVQGDIEHFAGQWAVEDQPGGGLIRFRATFDMGIPALSNIIDPIAEQALRENIVAIICGLFGL